MFSTNIRFCCLESAAIHIESILLVYLKESYARQVETKVFCVKNVEVRKQHPSKFSINLVSYYKVIFYKV